MLEGERRLAAVMFTDIVGYTAMSQRDEKHALKVLESHNDMLRPLFAKHGGTEVKTIGDSFLVEFASAIAATECAIEIQRRLAGVNRSPKDSPVMLRIGLHLGDVIRRGNDIFGDAVNIASRIQPLAEPGGICVSEEVYSVIRNKIPYPIEMVPAVSLKNVELPMNVYTIRSLSGAGEEKGILGDGSTRLAVLPLSNISPNPKDAYFADGLTEELITVLSQVQGLRVIARTSVDRYSKREKTVAQIARELQVGSVIEGSVRMARDRIRVTVQLINGKSEEHLWSENYDRKLDDIFAIQTDIAKQVAQALKLRLGQRDMERLEGRGSVDISAYASYVKGRALLGLRKHAELKQAKELFEAAIAKDPTFASAYAGLADSFSLLGGYYILPAPDSKRKARELLSKALELDPDLAEAHATLGLFLSQAHDFNGAETEFKRAITLNPSYANAHMWYSTVLACQGNYQESLEELRLAELGDPLSIIIPYNTALLLEVLGRGEEAAKKMETAAQLYPDHFLVQDYLAFHQYMRGNFAEAIHLHLKAVSVEQNAKNPNFLQSLVLDYAAIGDEEQAKEWLARLLALPEETADRTFFIATAYGALGDKDHFFEWMNRVSPQKSVYFGELRLVDRWIPAMSGIRQDSRFIELFKKVGLEA